jgi:glucose/arabinose dehydrogenase
MLRRISIGGALLVAAVGASAGGIPPDLALTPAVTGDLGNPIAVRNASDGTGRLFIADRYGVIRVRLPGSSTALPTAFLNLGALVFVGGEGGLLGLAFHPNYETNRQFYVHYSDSRSDAVVARYQASVANPDVADAATAQIVLRVDQDGQFHKGGDLHFGPDGMLYIALGDGGTDPPGDCNRSQTLQPSQLPGNDGNHPDCPADADFTNSGGNANSRALQGKILRIDVDGTTPAGSNELCASSAGGAANYAIPGSNPFAGTAGTAGNCDEIWHYGLRNPFRFSFDRSNGDMFIGDVGAGSMEEIDRAPAATGGLNFGWDGCEGTQGTCPGATPPILTYTHAANAGPCASITGGFRYRGSIGGLVGTYVYTDYCSGRILFGEENGGSWSSTLWMNGPDLEYATFGEDEAGELYLAEINGGVARFTSTSTPVNLILRDGFESP